MTADDNIGGMPEFDEETVDGAEQAYIAIRGAAANPMPAWGDLPNEMRAALCNAYAHGYDDALDAAGVDTDGDGLEPEAQS